MKVSELGEFGLIDLLAKMVESSRSKHVAAWRQLIVGIGDDAAAWQCDSFVQLATVDASIEGVHFTMDITPWRDLGWKSLAVSFSDIAGMGGIPHYALVSLALPPHTEVDHVVTLYRGMISAAKEFGVVIAGGNTSSSPVVMVDTVVMGSVLDIKGRVLTRASAKPGDKIVVTGYLGAAAGGFQMLSHRLKLQPEADRTLRKAFRHPIPRVHEGRLLLKHGVNAAIDISDGLVSDLRHICESSKVGAIVNADLVPIHPAVKANFPDKALELALTGGEDYELLFTAKSELIDEIEQTIGCPITVIGEIIEDEKAEVVLLDSKGKPFKLSKTGWDHFVSQ
ncbi:MAG: thiamine-phosphate kinase [Chloroflexi bacterium]|nr:thiamine-phosphate kinase [Chloroflexota bacterium]